MRDKSVDWSEHAMFKGISDEELPEVIEALRIQVDQDRDNGLSDTLIGCTFRLAFDLAVSLDTSRKAVDRLTSALGEETIARARAEQQVNEFRTMHLRDDDEHGLDCKKDHGQMLEPNPEGCAICRLLTGVPM